MRLFSALPSLAFAWLPQAVPAAPASRPAPRPPRYEMFAWRQGGPPENAAWAKALRALGFDGVNVEGAERPDHVRTLGLEFYADHLVRREIFHRDAGDPNWKLGLEEFERSRTPAALWRMPSLHSRESVERIRKDTSERAARAAAAGARFVSITDEPSYTVGANPFEYDTSPPALLAFRAQMRARFPNIAELRAVFGPSAEFDSLMPASTDDALDAWRRGAPWNFAAWNVTRDAADEALATALGDAFKAARLTASAVPAGFLGARGPGVFGGMHWGKLALLRPDVLEVYDVGCARDLVRALLPAVRLVDTAFLSDATDLYPAELAPARMSWLFARGGRASIVWSTQALFEPPSFAGADPSPTPIATHTAERAAALRRIVERAGDGVPEFDPVCIFYSHESLRLAWLLDARRDGRTWPRRFTTYENEHSTAQASLESWFCLLEDLGYAPGAAADAARAGAAKVAILPRCTALSNSEKETFEAALRGGGALAAEGRPALFDGSLRGGDGRSSLAEAAGFPQAPFAGFADENLEPAPLARRTADGMLLLEPSLLEAGAEAPFASSTAAGGRALALNVSIAEYRDRRLVPNDAAAKAMRALVRPFLVERAGAPFAALADETPIPVALQRERLADGSLLLFCTANVRRKPLLARRDPFPVALRFAHLAPGAVLERIDGENIEPLAPDASGAVRFTLDPLHLAAIRVRAK